MLRYLNMLRSHKTILTFLGILSISNGAFFWFADGDIFENNFPGTEFTEELELILKYSMEITAGVNWILGILLLSCTLVPASYVKFVVISIGIAFVTALPVPLRHSGGEWLDPRVILFCVLGTWCLFGGMFLKQDDDWEQE